MNNDPTKSPEFHDEAMHRLSDAIQLHLAQGLDDGTTQPVYMDNMPEIISREAYVQNGETILLIKSHVTKETGVATASFIEDESPNKTGLIISQALLMKFENGIQLTDYSVSKSGNDGQPSGLKPWVESEKKDAETANALADILEQGHRITSNELKTIKTQSAEQVFLTEEQSRAISKTNNKKGRIRYLGRKIGDAILSSKSIHDQ